MFADFQEYLKMSSGRDAIGFKPAAMLSDVMRKLMHKGAIEGRIAAQGRRGFRTKELPRFAAYLDHIKGWGKYKVTQTKYPSHFSFQHCRDADMANRVKAQEKRDRKNKTRLANFANYAVA